MYSGLGLGHKRRLAKKSFLRWTCYILLLILFYMLMTGGFFSSWQPLLVIPLVLAVSMFEREFGSALFGAFCGLVLDVACGNLFGMSSIWLMPCALAVSLLIMHLMRPNFINHLWMVAVTCFIMAFMEYFFNHLIWDEPNSDIILTRYIIPSYSTAVLLSPAVYFIIRAISSRFREQEKERFPEIEESENND